MPPVSSRDGDPAWGAASGDASLDLFRNDATAPVDQLAARVLAAFQVVKLAQMALAEVRRRRQ